MRLSIFLLLTGLLLVSCHNASQKSEDRVLDKNMFSGKDTQLVGKYVFMDDSGVLHADEWCGNLLEGNNPGGNKIYAKVYIDTTDLREVGRVCTEYVDTRTYEKLRSIVENNGKIVPDSVSYIIVPDSVSYIYEYDY